ncbi:PIN domain-containing protein [Roseateles sp. DB2]|uniref:PIN domain-containing protein n=1 Tax=Roseateles sp. DB2 TaxID=3453717 RepID=UPI003EE9A4DA
MITPKKEKTGATGKAAGRAAAKGGQGSPAPAKKRGQQKSVASPISTGARGVLFEHRVQATRLLAMCLDMPCSGVPDNYSIVKIAFQGRVLGHNTDDVVLTIASPTGETGTVRTQMKRALTPTTKNSTFEEAVGLAWLDFKQPGFRAGVDSNVIVYQSASAKAMDAAVEVARMASTTSAALDWHTKVLAQGFSNDRNREAFKAIQAAAELYNKAEVSLEELHQFVVHLKFLHHDLDSDTTAEVAMQKLVLATAFIPNPETGRVWAQLVQVCADLNSTGGDIDLTTVQRHIGQQLAATFHTARVMRKQRESGQIHFAFPAAAGKGGATTPFLGFQPGLSSSVPQASPSYMESAPAGRPSSPNKIVARHLESIDGLRKDCRFADAMAQLKVLGQDMGDFDDHQRALWYWLRGMSRWHLDKEPVAAADDLIKAASLCDDEDKLAAARIRGLFLKKQVDEALTSGKQAMERFPESFVVWAAYTNARVLSGEQLTPDDIPSEHAGKALAWHLIAAAQERSGDVTAAYESARTALTKEEVTFFTKEMFLRYALQLVSDDGLALGYRMLSPEKHARLEAAIDAFSDRAKSLWSVQSPVAQAAALTHLGYAYILTRRPGEALALIEEVRARGAPSDASLYGVEIEALRDAGRGQEVLTKFESLLSELPDEALIAYAQIAAVAKDMTRVEAAEAEGARRTGRPDAERLQNALRLMRWNVLMMQCRGAELRMEVASAAITPASSSIPDLVFAARAHLAPGGDKALAEQMVDRVAALCTGGTRPEDAHIGARLLLHRQRYDAAAQVYAGILPSTSFSELHSDLLFCYMMTGQRAKARNLLESMAPEWKQSEAARHIAIEMAQHAGDWPLVADLAEIEVAAAPKQATSWLLRIMAAASMGSKGLDTVIGQAPEEVDGSLQEIGRLAAAEMRHGHVPKGLRRIYRFRRQRMGDVEAAALHLTAVFLLETALPELEIVPEVVGPGTSVELIDDEGNQRWLTIDPEGCSGLPPTDEFVCHKDAAATRMEGLRLGESFEMPQPFSEPKKYRVAQLQSAHRRLIENSHNAVNTALSPPRSMAAMSLRTGEDGTLDLTGIQRQLQQRVDFANETMDFYLKHSATLGILARRLGRDVIDVVRGWPSTGPKLAVGAGSQGYTELQGLLTSQTPWVVDLTMLTELATLNHLEVLQLLPKVIVAPATRDAVAAKLESTAAFRRSGALFTHDGQIGFREDTEQDWRREREFLQSIAQAIEDHCTVLPAYGPSVVEPNLVQISKVLSAEEYSVLLLCLEHGAVLLTLDDRLRKLAHCFEINSAWLQQLLIHVAHEGRITTLDYSLAVIKLMLWRRTFVALTVHDLTAMMDQGDNWLTIGVNGLRDYLVDPVVAFDTAAPVIVRFIGWLYCRGNCELGVALELIEYLVEALLRHPDCPADWVITCTMALWKELAMDGSDREDQLCVSEFVRRASARTKYQMKAVTVKAKVLHFMPMPRFVSGAIAEAEPVAREEVQDEKRASRLSEMSPTAPTEGRAPSAPEL